MNKFKRSLLVLIEDARIRVEKTIESNQPYWQNFEAWKTKCKDTIDLIYGLSSRNLIEFNNIGYVALNVYATPKDNLIAFIVGMMTAKQKLEGFLFTVENFIDESEQIRTGIYPTIFLSRSEKAEKLSNRLKLFLSNLGATVIDVMEQPNLNLSLSNKITHYMRPCNCGIVLVTADETIISGEKREKPNIDHEMGLLEKDPNIAGKIIILKEDVVNLPTNYKEKGYISFNRSSFSDVFVNLVKELRGFGFY